MSLASSGRAALALTTVALLAACGGSGGSATNTESKASPTPTPTKAQLFTTVDACKLVAETDASTAAGTSVTQVPTGGAAAQSSICIFGSQGSDQNSQAGVIVITSAYPDQKTADAVQVDQLATAFGGQFGVTGVSNAKVVNGIGDKAVEYTATKASGNGGVGIFVFRSNVVIFIVLSPTSATSNADAATRLEALATVAVTNLDKQPKS